MMLLRIAPFLSLLAVLVCAGCSHPGTSAIESITVRVSEVTRNEAGGASMKVTYINASVLPIAVSETRHKLYLNGTLVGEVENGRPIGLQAAGAADQDIPLTLTATLPPAGSTAAYRLETTLIVMAGEERLTARPRAEGTLTVR